MHISNYGSITLLNCDYKIIYKVINNRIYGLLPKFINYDQSGFIRSRNNGDDVRLMLDIIDHANCKKVPGAVLSIDLCKAFNSLRQSYISGMLYIQNA